MAEESNDDYVQLAALGAEIHGVFDRITRQAADLTLVQFRALATLTPLPWQAEHSTDR